MFNFYTIPTRREAVFFENMFYYYFRKGRKTFKQDCIAQTFFG